MAYDIDLSGRVAFVTGASSGLGAQFARVLARAGAGVVLAARRVERLKTLRAEIEAEGGDAHFVVLDVNDHGSIRAAVAHAETEMGAIDILVNNSGVEHQYPGCVLRGPGSGQTHDRALARHGAGHVHGWAHREHRLHGRAALHEPDWRVRHEQGRGGAHDSGAWRWSGAATAST